MSLEGINRIHLAVEAFNRRDVDAILRWNHPNVVYQTAIASMEGGEGVYHGYEGVRQWTLDLDEAVEELHGDLEELYDLGDGRYLGAGRFQGRGRESGAEFDVPMAWVYLVEETEGEELLVRYEAYFEREKEGTAVPRARSLARGVNTPIAASATASDARDSGRKPEGLVVPAVVPN